MTAMESQGVERWMRSPRSMRATCAASWAGEEATTTSAPPGPPESASSAPATGASGSPGAAAISAPRWEAVPVTGTLPA